MVPWTKATGRKGTGSMAPRPLGRRPPRCGNMSSPSARNGRMPPRAQRISNTTCASSNSWTGSRMASNLADLFSSLAAVFNKASLRWYVFGAQAAIFYGSARLTADVDVTVLPGGHPLDELLDSLQEAGFEARAPDVHTLVRQTRVLPVTHTQSGMPVDIILGGPGLEEQFADFARPYNLLCNLIIPFQPQGARRGSVCTG